MVSLLSSHCKTKSAIVHCTNAKLSQMKSWHNNHAFVQTIFGRTRQLRRALGFTNSDGTFPQAGWQYIISRKSGKGINSLKRTFAWKISMT